MVYALIFVIIVLALDIIINQRNNIKKEELIKETNLLDYTKLYQKKIYLLTQEELKFYKLLKSITEKNNLNLFTQVSMYELVKANNIKDFNKIKSKTIDFVITDINCKIKVCIELDDATHVKENRQERDIFIDTLFQQLDIKLIRVPVQSYYNLQDLENKIKESL